MQKAAELKKEKEALFNQVSDLESSMASQIKYDITQIKEGDFVKIGMGNEVGTVNWIRKNKVEVLFGHMAVVTKLADLTPAKEPIEINRSRSVQSHLQQAEQTLTKLDLRGMSREDAIRMTEDFLDKAMLSNMHELTIVHGHGSGVLRKVVKSIAKQYKDIKEMFHPEFEAGGDGVTIIRL